MTSSVHGLPAARACPITRTVTSVLSTPEMLSHPKIDSELEDALRYDEHGTEIISTLDVRPNLRNAVWEARNRSHLIGLRAGSPTPSGLVGTMRSAVVNGMSIADITGNAHTVERTPTMADQLPIDSVMFTFVISGESFHFNGTSPPVLVKQGEVAIYDSDSPFMLGFTEAMHAVVASVPRHHLVDIGMQDCFRRLKVIRHAGTGVETEMARDLLDVLRGAFERPVDVDVHEFDDTLLANALRTLRRLSVQPTQTSYHYFTAATAYIESHFDDPRLSIADIAHTLSLSQRHLGRIFAARETTVARHIQKLRLQRARRLLASPESCHMGVAEVGHRCGFSSPSHFSKAFRAYFGVTPTEARRAESLPAAD
ncbi:AraC family transcriptional regulator (plasmid) [Rhodococcus sp. USK10]|uniref:AraC family transcriptional regulator n=1 Tax=Rhodococcus sp. USK10 TaxID=2789739 RepID=UPI001C5F509B|nr:AraC family transcriptional regulator [Rhodococcus sp. USK10]QYB00558.1 AraC family transcriptional regulator [Rhodococcus sp. USK10]